MIVRKLRLQRGWTQEQLAELAGISVRSIQRVERGQPASLETQKALAAVFEVELSTFQTGERDMNEVASISADERAAIEYVKGLKEFYSHLGMYLVFSVTFIAVFGIERPIILWGAIGWGLGVIIHGLNVYEVINFLGPAWEKRQIERRLGRKL